MLESLIYKELKAEQKMQENFEADGSIYLIICPKCNKENYATAVSSGICVWCGYDANKGGEE